MTQYAECKSRWHGLQVRVSTKAGYFYFCAPGCKKMFDAVPDKYIAGNDGKDYPNAFDPVCGTKIDNITIAERGEHAGKTYYFCCLGCKQLFNTIPEM
jgi:Cu+-exporting ATPase